VVAQAQAVQGAEAVLLLYLALFLLLAAVVAVTGKVSLEPMAALVVAAAIMFRLTSESPLLDRAILLEAQETLHPLLHRKAITA